MVKILQNHFVLAVQNLQSSAKFFEDLGFAIVSTPEGWIFLERDHCMVMLGECSDALPPFKLGDHSYFGYLRVDDVNSYYEDIQSKGVKILSPIENKPWNMREFAVASPEGHRIMIGQWIGEQKHNE